MHRQHHQGDHDPHPRSARPESPIRTTAFVQRPHINRRHFPRVPGSHHRGSHCVTRLRHPVRRRSRQRFLRTHRHLARGSRLLRGSRRRHGTAPHRRLARRRRPRLHRLVRVRAVPQVQARLRRGAREVRRAGVGRRGQPLPGADRRGLRHGRPRKHSRCRRRRQHRRPRRDVLDDPVRPARHGHQVRRGHPRCEVPRGARRRHRLRRPHALPAQGPRRPLRQPRRRARQGPRGPRLDHDPLLRPLRRQPVPDQPELRAARRRPPAARTALVGSSAGALFFGVLVAALVGIVLLGGIRSIASVTSRLVPAMAAIYIVACLVVILATSVRCPAPSARSSRAPSTPKASRAACSVRSSSASSAPRSPTRPVWAPPHRPLRGQDEAPRQRGPGRAAGAVHRHGRHLHHDRAHHRHRQPGELGEARAGEEIGGVTITSDAFATVLPWFPDLLTVAVLLFAFSTVLTWGYYGLKAWSYLFGRSRASEISFKVIYSLFAVAGSLLSLETADQHGGRRALHCWPSSTSSASTCSPPSSSASSTPSWSSSAPARPARSATATKTRSR